MNRGGFWGSVGLEGVEWVVRGTGAIVSVFYGLRYDCNGIVWTAMRTCKMGGSDE